MHDADPSWRDSAEMQVAFVKSQVLLQVELVEAKRSKIYNLRIDDGLEILGVNAP